MADNAANINTNGQNPKKVTSDGITVEQHSVKDQIEADRYEQASSAARSGPGIRLRKFKHRGPVF